MKETQSFQGSEAEVKQLKEIYQDYPEIPYISPDRNLKKWLADFSIGSESRVPVRSMTRTEEGLLPGDIIILWRISHGTFTTDYIMPKYFEYDYGINAAAALDELIEADYAYIESPYDSFDHVNASFLKNLLKLKEVKGYSKLKKDELADEVKAHYSNSELEEHFDIRGLHLTEKGRQALDNNQFVIDKHPKKM